MSEKQFLAIDIGGTYTKYAIINPSGVIGENNKERTPKDLDSMKALLVSIVGKFQDQITGVAVSAPGRVASKTGTIYVGGALPYLDGLSVRELIQSEYNLPTSAINDGKAAAQAELWLGNLREVQNGAVLILGTGVGGGLINEGKLIQGSHYQAGELSYLFRSPDMISTDDMMGLHGSAVRFIKRASEILQLDAGDNGVIVFEALNTSNNVELIVLFEEYLREIVFIILNLQAVLDFETVLIGGGISAQPILLEGLRNKYKEIKEGIPWWDQSFVSIDIQVCKFGNEANLLGAVYQLLLDFEADV